SGSRYGVSQTGYSVTFVGEPSFGDGSKTRRVPHPAAATWYGKVTSNVPQQPEPQLVVTGPAARARPCPSRISNRKVASKTFASPAIRAGLPSTPPHAGRLTKIAGSCSR